MKGFLHWPLALAVSLAVHAGFAVALLAALAPEPVPQQEPTEARLDMASYPVEQSEARPEAAAGDRAEERAPEGTAVSGDAIPVSRAEARAPEAEAVPEVEGGTRLAARVAAGARGAAAPGAGAALAAVAAAAPVLAGAPPEAERAAPAQLAAVPAAPVIAAVEHVEAAAFRPEPAVAAVAPAPVAVIAAPPPGARAGPVPPPAEAARAAAPEAERVARAEPQAGPAGAAAPPAQMVAQAVPQATAAPALPPPAEATKAALAWSGGAGAEVDPVSMAAIQSFMQEGDLAGAADPVRDGVEGLLASVPCARLQTVFDPATGGLELRGHVPEAGLREPVLAALKAQLGTAIPVTDDLRILPRPQCGALAGIAAVGLPQSEAQERNPRVMGEGAFARVYEFAEGDRLQFELTGPDYPAFFYIDYFDAQGTVLHLQPNDYVPLGAVGVKEVLQIGAAEAAGPSLDIRVAPPFGQEIMVAFAASEPLYAGLRPISEPAEPYLEALKAAVAEARAQDPGFKGEWVYFFVETRAR